MEQKRSVSFPQSRSQSSDRFLGLFSHPSKKTTSASTVGGNDFEELNEDDVFWTENFSESQPQHYHSISSTPGSHLHHTFRPLEKFGILAALPDDHKKSDSEAILLKSSLTPSPSSLSTTSFSRAIPPILEPHSEYKHSQSMPSWPFQQSTPMNIPVTPVKPNNGDHADGMDDDEMLPPHEIVARRLSKSPKVAFSMMEGAGRTLKGRDLRQVRNAVWRRTGFLEY